jgi:hypothetical protein
LDSQAQEAAGAGRDKGDCHCGAGRAARMLCWFVSATYMHGGGKGF